MMRTLSLLSLFLLATFAQAQSPLAAALEITYEGLEIRLNHTEEWLALPDGAVTAFGAGDSLRSGETGRAWLHFGEAGDFLILPHTEFTLLAYDEAQLQAELTGVALFDWRGEQNLSLQMPDIELADLAGTAGLWGRADEASIVTVSEGEARLQIAETEIDLQVGDAYRFGEESALPLDAPYNAARLIGKLDGCEGLVETRAETRGVLVRTGAGQGYQRRGLIEDSGMAALLGQTETSGWIRIQVGISFGWVTAAAVNSDCDLATLPDNSPEEDLSRVINADERELASLLPFFGSPALDGFFYSFEN